MWSQKAIFPYCKSMCKDTPSQASKDQIELKPRNSKEMFSSVDKYFAALIQNKNFNVRNKQLTLGVVLQSCDQRSDLCTHLSHSIHSRKNCASCFSYILNLCTWAVQLYMKHFPPQRRCKFNQFCQWSFCSTFLYLLFLEKYHKNVFNSLPSVLI